MEPGRVLKAFIGVKKIAKKPKYSRKRLDKGKNFY